VARRIEDAIAPYTTPGVEAAVLRLLGVPQAQRFADRLHRWGVLETGAAHWLAGAMIRLRAVAPASVTQTLLRDLEPADLAVPVEVAPQVLKHAVRGACRTLEARRRARDDRLAILAAGPGRRTVEVALDADTVPYDAADLVILAGPEATPPAEPALRHARERANRASERVRRYIRLGLRIPAADTAYQSTLAALTGLDAVVLASVDTVDAHFARRICTQAGVMVLGAGRVADDLVTELARAFAAEQLAALAGLPPTSWGWVPGHPEHYAALTALFPAAFIAHTGPAVGQDATRSVSYADVISLLESWPLPTIDPATVMKKAPGYWNPFV